MVIAYNVEDNFWFFLYPDTMTFGISSVVFYNWSEELSEIIVVGVSRELDVQPRVSCEYSRLSESYGGAWGWMMKPSLRSPDTAESDSGRSSLCLATEHIQRSFLSCQLCGQVYNKPRVGNTTTTTTMYSHHNINKRIKSYGNIFQILPCLHTFCTGCLWNFTPR